MHCIFSKHLNSFNSIRITWFFYLTSFVWNIVLVIFIFSERKLIRIWVERISNWKP